MKWIIIETEYRTGSGSGNEERCCFVEVNDVAKEHRVGVLKKKNTKKNNHFDYDVYKQYLEIIPETDFNKISLSVLIKANINVAELIKLLS